MPNCAGPTRRPRSPSSTVSAQLERARSEAAALRTLANSARLLEEHPALLRLRTLQVAAEPGTTIVLTPPA